MSNIRNKLNQQGVSILLALLVFLVCSLIASVLITSASASVGRVVGRTEEEQRFISSQSAAKIIADQYNGMRLFATTKNNSIAVQDNILNYIAGSYIKQSVITLLNNPSAEIKASTFNVNISGNNGISNSNFDTISDSVILTGTIKMNSDFSIYVTVSANDASGSPYTVSFLSPASAVSTDLSSADKSTERTVTVITWGPAQMSREDR